MSFLGFGPSVDVSIAVNDEQDKRTAEVKDHKDRKYICPIYYDGENVSGQVGASYFSKLHLISWQVSVRVKDGKKITHDGIKVEFIGTIELFHDKTNHHDFLALSQELAGAGDLRSSQTFDFNFKNVEKAYESYHGINVSLKYLIRVTLSRRMNDVVREKELYVHSHRMPPEINDVIKMEVGIEDCLHIEFEYSKSKYHLKDVIVGKIFFLLVRIKIKHMELSIIKRESTGSGHNQYNESDTITKYEIMDGAPVRGRFA